MKPERWITLNLAIFLAVSVCIVFSSYELDIFGIFHDPTGKQLSVYEDVRTAKYFLNQRYVPSNFDAIMVGSSSTVNWDMSELDFAHVYNDSLAGGNIAEVKRLVDEAIPSAHFKYAICVIHPFFLQSHEFHEGRGRPTHREALGSINVLREEWNRFLHDVLHHPVRFYPSGSESILSPVDADPFKNWTFTTDPVALDDYRQLLDELRGRGVKIIFLETPFYEPSYQQHKAELDAFYRGFPLRKPGEPLIDFNLPEFKDLRSNPGNWMDPAHLRDPAAKIASDDFNRKFHEYQILAEDHSHLVSINRCFQEKMTSESTSKVQALRHCQ